MRIKINEDKNKMVDELQMDMIEVDAKKRDVDFFIPDNLSDEYDAFTLVSRDEDISKDDRSFKV